ncbi:MAG: helix-turn-helix transcriptional regulator [Prosthecobacter sp.]|jgi:AraC-like DNA-binding protein|uniref:helix-turn-helix transcriptional regulator n=1 Tax=Prosthecobacter sp. TaxID=1965333 RepID=UPI001A04F2B9|nr:AraC family transcriptional regulator [Prosthecobacter sp.]MBE2284396.1 helix-turn-helix transcriptional regulator [Prosthecobacter sp.]
MPSRFQISARQIGELYDCASTPDGREAVARPRGPWASGAVHFHQARSWAAMHWSSGRFDTDVCVQDDEEAPPAVLMAFAIEGAWRERHLGQTQDFGRTGGQMSLIHGPSLQMHCALRSERSTHLTVALRQDRLLEYFAEDRSAGVARLMRLARGEGRPDITLPLSLAARNAVEQVRLCPFQGPARGLMLEARFADLLLEMVQALSGDDDCRRCQARLLRADEEKIRFAADLLVRRMEQPPSLAELAQAAGLCESKLKRGFQQIFGTTAFGYLKTRRMEHARTLLESGAASVMEAALSVGYSNPSHFAAAFRQQFGQNPKKLQLTAGGRNHAVAGWNPPA